MDDRVIAVIAIVILVCGAFFFLKNVRGRAERIGFATMFALAILSVIISGLMY